MDCSFVAPYQKILTYMYTYPHPQNSSHWPLCKSANFGIAAGNTAEKYVKEGPTRLPLWQWQSPQPTEIHMHVAFPSKGKREITWWEMESVWKVWRNGDGFFCHLFLVTQVMQQEPVPPASKLRRLTKNWTAQSAKNHLVVAGACLHFLLLGWIPREKFRMSRKTIQALPCFVPVL
jgi:hypothetical protein